MSGYALFADVKNEWTPDPIVTAAVLVCAVAVAAAVIVVVVCLAVVHRRKKNAADPAKNKLESALLVSPQSNETLLDMLMDGTGSGSGRTFRVFICIPGGAVVHRVRQLGLRSVGRGFKSCSRQCCVTTLGKLFKPMCLCHQAV